MRNIVCDLADKFRLLRNEPELWLVICMCVSESACHDDTSAAGQ